MVIHYVDQELIGMESQAVKIRVDIPESWPETDIKKCIGSAIEIGNWNKHIYQYYYNVPTELEHCYVNNVYGCKYHEYESVERCYEMIWTVGNRSIILAHAWI